MDYKIHQNGWTIILDNFEFNQATQTDINAISKLLSTNTLVIAKNQNLSVEDHLRVTKMFKDPACLFSDTTDKMYKRNVVPNTEGLILRVGGELNEDGEHGIAGGVDEIFWHSDPHWPDLKCMLIFLLARKGTANSTTSWINNIKSYNDLDLETKNLLKSLKAILLTGIDFDKGLSFTDNYGIPRPVSSGISKKSIPVIQTNTYGITGMYFPFNQIHGFEGVSEKESKDIIKHISNHITQEQYCYHHNWSDSDVVITDQRFGIHMRHRCEHTASRLLHRSVFDYSIE
jgi:alpha-ketoglutarate-dependent taurine dioxygenase